MKAVMFSNSSDCRTSTASVDFQSAQFEAANVSNSLFSLRSSSIAAALSSPSCSIKSRPRVSVSLSIIVFKVFSSGTSASLANADNAKAASKTDAATLQVRGDVTSCGLGRAMRLFSFTTNAVHADRSQPDESHPDEEASLIVRYGTRDSRQHYQYTAAHHKSYK